MRPNGPNGGLPVQHGIQQSMRGFSMAQEQKGHARTNVKVNAWAEGGDKRSSIGIIGSTATTDGEIVGDHIHHRSRSSYGAMMY